MKKRYPTLFRAPLALGAVVVCLLAALFACHKDSTGRRVELEGASPPQALDEVSPHSIAPVDRKADSQSTEVTALAAQGRPQGTLAQKIQGREMAKTFPPLDNPVLVGAEQAKHMRPNDIVLGVVVDGKPRAYPWWVVKNYHAVNDRIAQTPVLVAFCEQCSTGTAFHRDLDGRVLSMFVPGVCKSTIMLEDRETGSIWAPFHGRALEGPLEGKQLKRIPVHMTSWDTWKRRHPDTDVVYDRPEQRFGHGERYHPGGWGVVGMMGETVQNWDSRLPENALVFGAMTPNRLRAYPLAALKAVNGVLNDELDATKLVLLAKGDFEVAGFRRTVDGRDLSFVPHDSNAEAMARDQQTGSLWSVEGWALEGELKGRQLTRVEGYLAEWHVWAEYHPKTEIYGADSYVPPVGFSLPDLKLRRLGGGPPELVVATAPGVLRLVVLWAHWCSPCREKLPKLQETLRKYGPDVSAISIAVIMASPQEVQSLNAFVQENKIDRPVYLIDDAAYERLDATYRSQGGRGLHVPMAFIVDHRGKVVSVLEGDQVADAARTIDRLIGSRHGDSAAPAPSGQ